IDYNFTSYELSCDINNKDADYPGRTYQYYKGTPVYEFGYGSSYTSFEYSDIAVDKANADANDIVTITADVTNTGNMRGTEVAQLYISVPGAGENNIPIKQLKGFERIELEAGETKTVTFKLDISDVFFFDEQTQKNYVVNGEYTAKVGGSSADAAAQEIRFNVSGDIAETLKNVYTIPSGLKVYGAVTDEGVKPAIGISAGASVALKNDKVITDFAENGITVTYTSANTAVAAVDADGNVSAGTLEGTTTITVTAVKGESTVTTSFPVVTQFKDGMTEDARASYLKILEDTYNSCPEIAYTAENWLQVKAVYDKAYGEVSAALLDDGLELLVKNAVSEMLSVPKIELTEEYTLKSANGNIIKDNRIEYSADGIGTYTAGETTISGTVTADNPAEIAMQAFSGDTEVKSALIWTAERLDGSSRKNAEIDMQSGVMRLYENGVYKITASDYANKKSGSITVYANLQIEGESADDGGGADLADEKAGASGGRDAGSTNDCWLRFDGVKLDRLTGIVLRTSQKDAASTVNVSLMANTDWIIASASVPQTGAWSNWAETAAEVNRYELSKLTLDENGCGTIYIQTNKANLDYIRLVYDNSDIDAFCLANGSIGVNVSADSGTLIAEVGGAARASAEINGKGNYRLSGFNEGDEITLKVTDGEVQAGEAVTLTYTPAQVKDLTVYNFSDSVFDSFFYSAEGTSLSNGVGMYGFGGCNTDKVGSCTYG
ncbi:MAG: fibronectin type III-like domain-contianing protein, partial [Candidatus Ornithomonoglobus sp.]